MSLTGCTDEDFGPTSCQRFDFTLLFEQSILSTLPCALLLLLGPLRLYWLYNSSIKVQPHGMQNAKMVATLAFVGLQLALVIAWSLRIYTHIRTQISVTSSAISFANAVLISILSFLEHQRSYQSSSLLLVYLLMSSIFDSVQLRTLWLMKVPLIATLLSLSLASKTLLFLLESYTKAGYIKEPFRSYSSESRASIITWSFLWWLNRLLLTGFRKVLTYDDLSTVHENIDSRTLEKRMETAWEKRGKPESCYALPIAAAYCFFPDWLITVAPRLALVGFNYAQPFLITRAITLLKAPDAQASIQSGYGLIVATFIIYFGRAIATVHYRQRVCRIIAMFRGAMVTLIYNRTLYLQGGMESESAALTLMSTDIDNIVDSLEPINEIWGSAIEIIIGIWLLQRQLGAICVVPIFLTLVCTFGQMLVAKSIGEKRQLWTQAIQERVATTASSLSSMKALKLMGFEKTVGSMLQGLRVHELSLSGGFMWLIIALNVLASLPAIWSPAVTFICYTIQAKIRGIVPLSTTQAFTSLAIISLVTKPAERFMAAVPHAAACMTCFTRIQTYLLLPSMIDRRVTLMPRGLPSETTSSGGSGIELNSMSPLSQKDVEHAVIFSDASLCPAPGTQPVLSNVTFSILKSSLVIVIGPIGSGKTTLAKAILGELTCERGSVSVATNEISYCHQTPWLVNRSVLQSVCGLSMDTAIDERWYRKVIWACCLDPDIKLLPEGDHSIIGNNGLTLSGGQKQRLALARAVYSRKETIVLDDVFSAQDAKTENAVFDRLLGKQGLLKKIGATIVLITHSARHLPFADKLVILKDGLVDRIGSYSEIMHSSTIPFDSMLSRLPHSPGDVAEFSVGPSNRKQESTAIMLEEEADNATRRIGDTEVYKYYSMLIGWKYSALFILANIGYAFSITFPGAWLVLWMREGNERLQLYLSIYALLALAGDFFLVGNMWITFVKILQRSSARLHIILLESVMSAPQTFFSQTDAGVILNKFSQDMSLVDNQLPIALNEATSELCSCIAQAALIFAGSSYMAITAPVAVLSLYLIQNVYLKTSRQLRHMDLEAKSPIYSHFLETLEGLSTIRAFGWQQSARNINLHRLDISQKPYYLLFSIQRWLNLVLDLLVAALATILVSLAFFLRHTSSPELLGVALTTVLLFNETLSKLIAAWTSLETSLGAIARVKAFAETTPVERKAGEEIIPPEEWPQKGEILFNSMSAAHDDANTVLHNITFRINPGEKIGICGRTGSGKSSLIYSILRLIEISTGDINIDGVDISTIPRHLIRSRIITIPQDRFVLTGSIRRNADPSGMMSGESIQGALEKVHLWRLVESRGGLDTNMENNLFSSGQQQLFRLARAILIKENRTILILDEATSNVDAATDSLMQSVIQDIFEDFTIITIAHRLDTIMSSDKIAVLDQGKLVEFDSPINLRTRNGSAFNTLYNATFRSPQ